MLHSVEIIRPTEVAVRHRIVEYEARAAHEMARARVVDRAIVSEEVIEPAARIDGAWVIERHSALNMIKQYRAAAKVREGLTAGTAHGSAGLIFSSTRSTN